MAEAKEGILLESGTNEVEVLEFVLAGQGFGVNVAKTQAIEQYDPAKVTKMPQGPFGLEGMLLFRNRTIPLINLGKVLGVHQRTVAETEQAREALSDETSMKRIVLVMEFNNVTSAVLADGVNRIHRISWDTISPLSPMLADDSAKFTGSVNIEKREILIVDMERIVADIMPTACMSEPSAEELAAATHTNRGDVRIILAEDSAAIRHMMESVLIKGGYEQVQSYDNGQAAWDAIVRLREQAREEDRPITDYVTAVISDIEMPKMDGLTLCKTVKQQIQPTVPVMMFSSLINEQMAAKCRSVGANAWISKPQIAELIGMMDELCLAKEPAGAS